MLKTIPFQLEILSSDLSSNPLSNPSGVLLTPRAEELEKCQKFSKNLKKITKK